MGNTKRRELDEADTALASASRSLAVGNWRAAEASTVQAQATYQAIGLAAIVAHCDELLGQLQQAADRDADAVVAYALARRPTRVSAYTLLLRSVTRGFRKCEGRQGPTTAHTRTKREPMVAELSAT